MPERKYVLGDNCHGRVGMGCDNNGSAAACFPYWAQVEQEWQNSSMSLDMLGQNTASLAKRREYSGPRCE